MEIQTQYKQEGEKMSKTATLTVRLDPVLKKQTEKVLSEMGLTPSQAITLFYYQVKNQRALPFEIKLPRQPNEETLQAIDDLKQRRDTKTFKDVEALIADLES
jgi:DNA-damage-inducible protein J